MKMPSPKGIPFSKMFEAKPFKPSPYMADLKYGMKCPESVTLTYELSQPRKLPGKGA